jgi:hypothetical protein
MSRSSVQIDGRPFPATLVDGGAQLRLDGDADFIVKAHSLAITYGFREIQERTVSYDVDQTFFDRGLGPMPRRECCHPQQTALQ